MANGEHIEIAKAYISIIPSLEGSQKQITTELTGVTNEAAASAGSESGAKFGDKFAGALKTAAGVIAGAMAAATAGAVATGKAFIDATNDVATYGDEVDKMSQKMGISATAYQEWDFVMQHAGASIESLKGSMKTLANAAVNGSEAFDALGISQEQIATMSQEELFGATISALQNVEDETTRTALASQVLGKGATELGALFNMSAEETDALKQQVHDLGGVMSDEAVKDAAAYVDAMTDMKTSLKGLKTSMMSQFLPGITSVMTGLSKVFSGNGGIEEIQSGLESLISKITELAPQFLELGQTLILALISGFAPMLPQLVSTVFNVLIQGIVTLTSMIPQMMPSIISGIQGIMAALFDALPVIISGLTTLIMSLVTWLADGNNVRTFVDGLINLVGLICNQLGEILPVLLPAIVTIISEVALALTDPSNVQILLTAVLAVAKGIFEALVNTVPVLINFIIGLFGNLGELMAQFLDWASDGVASGIGAIVDFLKGIGTKIKTGLTNVWENIKNTFTNGINNIKTNVTNGINNIKSFFTNGIDNIKNNVTNGLNSIKDKFHNIFETVKNTVKNGIDKVKSFFDFDWELPHIDLPHFSVSGSFSLDPPRVPSFGISWYAKAMTEPMMLNGATIFGAQNGRLLGGGEVGSEVVIGKDKLLDMMREAVGINGQPITINVYGAEGQSVEALADAVAYKLQDMTTRKGKVYA